MGNMAKMMMGGGMGGACPGDWAGHQPGAA